MFSRRDKETNMITDFHRSVVITIAMRSCMKLFRGWQRALAIFIGGAIALNAAHAAAPQVKTQAPGYYRMMLGDFEVTVLNDGTLSLPASVMTNTTEAETEQALARNFQKSPFDASDNAFLINTGAKLVLIDTGCGNLMGPTAGNLLMNLKAAGYRPEQIDEVYLTHMHPDHAGGLMAEGKLAFPNAVLRANRREADFWLSEANLEKSPAAMKGFFKGAMASVNPYIAAGKFRPFEGDTQLVPGIEVIAAPGHTPGHSIYSIESGGQKMLLWGDLVHVAAVQFGEPSVTVQFDVDSQSAAMQRQHAYADAAKAGYLVGTAHLSFPGIGHIRAEGKGYAWVPVNYSVAVR
jgi:glyoxylase-like metal-dependent hydrolase (beta-lactamase superfamily II)